MVTIQRPDSDPATWTSKNNAPKTVRVMQLANMDIDPEEIFVYDKNAETTNEEQDDDEEEQIYRTEGRSMKKEKDGVFCKHLLERGNHIMIY